MTKRSLLLPRSERALLRRDGLAGLPAEEVAAMGEFGLHVEKLRTAPKLLIHYERLAFHSDIDDYVRITWADEATSLGPLHADFKLSTDGEAVSLYDKDGVTRIDAIEFPKQQTDVSYGRIPDGGAVWSSIATPTPGRANPATGN